MNGSERRAKKKFNIINFTFDPFNLFSNAIYHHHFIMCVRIYA